MTIMKSRTCKARLFGVGEIHAAFRNLFSEFAEHPDEPRFLIFKNLQDGSSHSEPGLSINDLDTVCDVCGNSTHLETRFNLKGKEPGYASLTVQGYTSSIVVSVKTESATHLVKILDQVCEELHLEETHEDEDSLDEAFIVAAAGLNERFSKLDQRLQVIERHMQNEESRLKCFLSFRFNQADKVTALEIQRFLTLLGVTVISGAGYEPRRISEKVAEKLSQSIDLVVVLITGNEESTWIRDEIITGRERGASVVPLVEIGSKFTPGLFGDLEYIPFAPGHIGDAFVGLLEAVYYVRSQRQFSVAPHNCKTAES